MTSHRTTIRAAASVAIAALCATAQADVRLPAIFGDHMVLQRDAAVPVWGWADPGETVTIKADSATATATTDANGKWSAKLNALATRAEPITLHIAGKNTIELTDVLVGDVWLCAGQSNMGWSLGAIQNSADVVPKAKDDQLRLFMVENPLSFEPKDDCKGKWVLCTPGTASNFSAVGYFLGRDLREHLKIPIGLIGTNVGGSSSQAWTSRKALNARPALAKMMAAFKRDEAALREKLDTYYAKTIPQWQEADKAWRRDVNPAYQTQLQQWNAAVKQAKANGQTEPPKPQPRTPRPSLAAPPNRQTPTMCYNGLLAPLIPFAITGVAWYQGEHNTFDPKLYADLFPAMIEDWRSRWGQGDFPFVYVQIADNAPQNKGGLNFGKWAPVREVQLNLDLPKTAMAVSVDVGDPNDVHARNKQPVGQRVALAVRHIAYGEELAWSGPIFDRMELTSGGAVLHFKHTGSGLMTGKAPTVSPFATLSDEPVIGFEIAGADRKFVSAKVTIDGQTVIVNSPQVSEPVAVRYGWSDAPQVNLYNREGLPASPFRTDSWDK